jgi:tRNA pseudouridine55 synthase
LAIQPTKAKGLPGANELRESKAHTINGVLLLDKPTGLTSNAAVQTVRRLFERAKAGHTGTLDPLASGLLPICIGEATKFSHPLLEASKSYRASLRLGWRSTTGDAEGELSPVAPPDFNESELSDAVSALTGEIEQLPPMYSAIKVNGQPLYALARKGISIDRAPRRVTIFRFDATRQLPDTLEIAVSCSKGTYIRVLAEDLGERLGCGAYLTALRRVSIGSIDISEAVGLDLLEAASATERLALLRPVDLLLDGLPKVILTMDDSTRLGHGLSISGCAGSAAGQVRIYSAQGDFLGLGEVTEDGVLKPKRLVS